MTDLERAESAFLAAHKAGDKAAAAVLAQHVRDLRAGTSQPSGSANAGAAGTGAGVAVGNGPEGIPGLVPGTKTIPSDTVTGTGVLKGDDTDSTLDQLKYGLGGVGVQGYLGLKNNFGKLDAEDQRVLKQSEDDVQRSGTVGKVANTLGQVGGGVASAIAAGALVPEAAVAAVPAVVRAAIAKSPLLKGTLNYIKNAGAAGAQEGLTAPAEDQEDIVGSKLKRAGVAAGLGVGLKGVTDVLQMPMRGMFRASKDAIDLMKQGVTPTLQQGGDSWLSRFVGGLTTGAFKHGERQGEEVTRVLGNRVGNGNVDIPPGMTLNELTGQLEASIGQDKANLFKGKLLPMTAQIRDDALREADKLKLSGGRGLDPQREARGALDDVIGSDRNAVRMTEPRFQRDYMDRMDNKISRARDEEAKAALISAKEVLEQKSRRSVLNAEEKATLDEINGRLYDLARMNEAKGTQGELPGFKIKSIVDAYGNQPDAALNVTNQELIGPIGRVLGKQPNQNQARAMLVNSLRVLGGLGTLGTAAVKAPYLAAPYAISLAGQTGPGAKALFGQYPLQRKLTSAFDSPATDDVTFANLLRAMRDNASNQGASFTGN